MKQMFVFIFSFAAILIPLGCSNIAPKKEMNIPEGYIRYVIGVNRQQYMKTSFTNESPPAIIAINVNEGKSLILAHPNADEHAIYSPRYLTKENLIYYVAKVKSAKEIMGMDVSGLDIREDTHIRAFHPGKDPAIRNLTFDYPIPQRFYSQDGKVTLRLMVVNDDAIYFKILHGNDAHEGIYCLSKKDNALRMLFKRVDDKGVYNHNIEQACWIDNHRFLCTTFNPQIHVFEVNTAKFMPVESQTVLEGYFSLSPSGQTLIVTNGLKLDLYHFPQLRHIKTISGFYCFWTLGVVAIDDRHWLHCGDLRVFRKSFLFHRSVASYIYDPVKHRSKKVGPPMWPVHVVDIPKENDLEYRIADTLKNNQ